MKQNNARVYYKKSTGEVLVITPECIGTVIETTKEDDIKLYQPLKDRNIDEIDFIELEYGTLENTFNNAKSYKVNLETKQLEVIYYTNEELTSIQVQYQETQDVNLRVSDIASYLSSSDSTTIADIENSILEIEKNKIINGGI
jgi:hypothetical protein